MPDEEDSKPGAMKGNDRRSIVGSAPGAAAAAAATAATATLQLMSSASSYSSAAAEAATTRAAAGHHRYARFASVPQQSSQAEQLKSNNNPAGAPALPAAPTSTEASAATSYVEEKAARCKNIMAQVAGGRVDQHQHQLLQQLLRQRQPLQEQRIHTAAPLSATKNPSVVPLVHPKLSVNFKRAVEALRLKTTTDDSVMNALTAGEASAASAVAIHKRDIPSTTLPPSLSPESSSSSPLSNLTFKKRTAVMMKAKHRPLPLMRSQLQCEQQPIIKVKNNDDNNNKSNGFAPSLPPQSLTTQKRPSSMSGSNQNSTTNININSNTDTNRTSRSTPPAQTKPKSNRQSGESLLPQTGQERPQQQQQQQKNSSSLSPVHTIVTNEPQYRGRRPGFAARTLEQLQDVTQHWYTQAFRQQQNPSSSSGMSPSAIERSNEENFSSTTTRMFTLYFNESSVQAVAFWANYYNLRNENSDNKNMNGFLIPTVDVRYRLCGTCYLYGHYELECPSLSRDLTLRFAKDLQTAIRTQQEQELMKKQRQQLQSTQRRDGDATEMLDNDADKHREIPYDVAVENCDGYLIEQRAESELDVTEVDDGVVMQAAASAEAFLGVGETNEWRGENTAPPHDKSQKLHRGDLVAWLLPSAPADISNENEKHASDADTTTDVADVCVGVVEDESPQSPDQILIKVVDTIPREQTADSSKFPRDVGPPMDSCVWVERGDVHLAAEPTRLLQSRRSILLGKRKTGWLENKSRSPRAIKQRKDGTFARPSGRTPVGHRWDAAMGNWVPEAA